MDRFLGVLGQFTPESAVMCAESWRKHSPGLCLKIIDNVDSLSCEEALRNAKNIKDKLKGYTGITYVLGMENASHALKLINSEHYEPDIHLAAGDYSEGWDLVRQKVPPYNISYFFSKQYFQEVDRKDYALWNSLFWTTTQFSSSGLSFFCSDDSDMLKHVPELSEYVPCGLYIPQQSLKAVLPKIVKKANLSIVSMFDQEPLQEELDYFFKTVNVWKLAA